MKRLELIVFYLLKMECQTNVFILEFFYCTKDVSDRDVREFYFAQF